MPWLTFVVGLLVGVGVVVAVLWLRPRLGGSGRRDGVGTIARREETTLDLRPVGGPEAGDEGLQLWWDAQPIMSIQRLDARQLPASQPVPGALATLVSGLLDDPRVRGLVEGDRYAMVRVPRGMRRFDWVRSVDGRTLPVMRDPDDGRYARIATVVGGARAGSGVGSTAVAAPVVAAAVAAAWAHEQLESTMTAIRAGMERISLRLDDTDHGAIAAAQSQINRLSGHPSGWSELDLAEMAAHRTALERVYHTAQRRAERRFDQLTAGDRFPKLDAAEVDETQRDVVLLVDATLARGQSELVRALTRLDGSAERLAELGRVEEELHRELEGLADRLDQALERAEPGWHRVGARRKALHLKSELARTLGGLEELVTELNADRDAELLITNADGRLEVRSIEPPSAQAADD